MINLPKEAKDPHSRNYKMLIRKTEDDTYRWKDIQCSWTEGINIVKETILPEAVHRFSAVVIKLQIAFFTELERIYKICREAQNTSNSQSKTEKEKQSWRNWAP